MTVPFAQVCDKCDHRSPEYARLHTCRKCGEDICEDCDVPQKRGQDDDTKTLCKECA